MKGKKIGIIINSVELVVLVAAVIVSVAMGGCTTQIECVSGSVPMKCHWTFMAVPFALLPGIGAILCCYGVKDRLGRLACRLVAVLAACSVVCLTGFAIGVCSGEGMHCRTTANIVDGLCLLFLILSLVSGYVERAGDKDKPKAKI